MRGKNQSCVLKLLGACAAIAINILVAAPLGAQWTSVDGNARQAPPAPPTSPPADGRATPPRPASEDRGRKVVPAVPAPRIASLALHPARTVGATEPIVGTLTLGEAASPEGVEVRLASSNPALAAVPSSVVVQPGATSATFIVQTLAVAADPDVVRDVRLVQVSARIRDGSPATAELAVLPATISSLILQPGSIQGGGTVVGELHLSGPAPESGFTVALTAEATTAGRSEGRLKDAVGRGAGPVTLPPQLTVAPGATSATFEVQSRVVPAATPVAINAAYGVFSKRTVTLMLLPVGVASVSVGDFIAGQTATGTVTLTSPAPAGGAEVKLEVYPVAASAPLCTPVPQTPATVTVNPGETHAAFPVTTYPAGLNPNWFTVRAAYGSSAATTDIHVGQAKVADLTLPESVKGGTTVQLGIGLTGPMGQCPSNVASPLGTIVILNSNSLVAQAPAHVQVPGGGSSTSVSITTSAVVQPTTVTFEVYHVWEYDKKTATLTLTP